MNATTSKTFLYSRSLARIGLLLALFSVVSLKTSGQTTARAPVCWADAKTGALVPKSAMAPAGSTPDSTDPRYALGVSGPNGEGGQYFRSSPDAPWVDSTTGSPIPEDNLVPTGTSAKDANDLNRVSRPDGSTYVRVPCPPPTSSAPPPPPAHAANTANPSPSNLTPYQRMIVETCLKFGATGRTDTYDDGYKAGGTSLLLGVSGGIAVPITPTIFVGADLNVLFPFQSSTVTTTKTKLETAGLFEVTIGADLKVEDRPIKVWGGFGAAVGAVQSGYTSPSLSYSDTEVLKGITFSGGVSTPIGKRLGVMAEIRYIDLFSGNFASPGSTYSMKDSGIEGSVGIQYRLK